jgi:hypothetical protein
VYVIELAGNVVVYVVKYVEKMTEVSVGPGAVVVLAGRKVVWTTVETRVEAGKVVTYVETSVSEIVWTVVKLEAGSVKVMSVVTNWVRGGRVKF